MTASTVNAFYSHLVLSACSNKSIDVMDLNVGKSLLRIEDAHESKIHTIAQNQVAVVVVVVNVVVVVVVATLNLIFYLSHI